MARWGLVAAVLLIATSMATRAGAEAPPPDPQRIDQSIRRAVNWIYARQSADGDVAGTWEQVPAPIPGEVFDTRSGQHGGLTSLAVYALLSAGEKPTDARLKPALAFLYKADIKGIYAAGTRAQLYTLLPDSRELRNLIRRDAETFLAGVRADGQAKGFYSYTRDNPDKYHYDHSVSQFGVLGMWACAQNGLNVPPAYWEQTEKMWRAHQYDFGAWSYNFVTDRNPRGDCSVSMTAAGVASLFIAQDQLAAARRAENRATREADAAIDAAIDKGIGWIVENYRGATETHQPYYALWGVSRIGAASGRKHLGHIDWFREGAEWMLQRQREDGSFGNGELPDTCFAIIFLSRGLAPVMMSKLQYDVVNARTDKTDKPRPGNWNARPRDLNNLARWFGRQTERFFNWQTVSLEVAPEDLHDAPILFIAGDQPLQLSDEDKSKLKAFVEQGGMILFNADGGDSGFAKSANKLGTELFPAYEFRELPSDHPIYSQQFRRSQWRSKPSVLGLSNGARELMVLVPRHDPSKVWHTQQFKDRSELAELAANLYLYVADKRDLRYRPASHIVKRDETVPAGRSVRVARLQYAGNWDPEPGGWRRLANLMHNRDGIELEVSPVAPKPGALDGFAIAHLTGTAKFTLNDAERAEIRRFVEAGGTLIVDACGGSTAFAASAESELASLFGADAGQLAEPLAEKEPIYASAGTGEGRIEQVTYRTAQRSALNNLTVPRLRSIRLSDRHAVFYSPEDLSVGIVGQPVDGVTGYAPASATALMRHLIRAATEAPKVADAGERQ